MKFSKNINQALSVLRKSGTIVYPTDTVYGLGADVDDLKAIKSIYKIKGRSSQKPIGLIAADINQVKKIAKLNKEELNMMKRFWPGPLTILLKVNNKYEGLSFIGQGGYVGVRVPDNQVALELAKKLGRPLIATSANLSGQKECFTTFCVVNQFMNKLDYPGFIYDGGRLPRSKPSTIIKWKKGVWQIIRKGKIKIDD